MYGIALIVVIAAMGGVIAYIGDNLGAKIGKKRMSIFGLRPKHTSILVTIVTGILIAAVTLGTMNVVSRDVRTALFGMEELKSRATFLNKEVMVKTKELESSYAELSAKNIEYEALNKKIEETFIRLKEIAVERDRASEELKELQTNYDEAQKDLTKSYQDIKDLTFTKKELDAKIKELTSAHSKLQADVESLQTLAESLRRGIENVRGGTVILRAGEVLATVVFKPGQSKEIAEENLVKMIRQTNRTLLDRFEVTDKTIDLLWITQLDFDRTVSGLANAEKETIVRISTLGNTVYGEPIIGYIDLFSNERIYKKGQVIYFETFPLAATDKQAEETVLFFLHKVNNEAIERGVLPDPLYGTVGSMSGAQLFDIIDKVKRQQSMNPARGKIEFLAIATEDISTVGPLQIDIRIRSVL